MSTFRGFIAIDIDPTEKIKEFSENLKKINAKLKMVELKNLHVTLKFLGETEEEIIDEIERCMRDAVKDVKPFKIKLQGVGAFPNLRRINVIWIGTEGREMEVIFRRLEEGLEKLGYSKEKRDFSPHLTIARVKSVGDKNNLISILGEYSKEYFGEQIVESIKLKKSILTEKGPIYSTIREVKLEEK